MAGDRFYIVRDSMPIDGSFDYFWKDYTTEAEQLGAFCWGLNDGGLESENVAMIIVGGGAQTWKAENSVLYADKAKALADAKKRLAALKKKAGKTKKASVAERVASRFKGAVSGR